MARKRKESGIEVLFGLPWWTSAILAGVALFVPEIIKMVFPTGSGQMGPAIKQGLVAAAESYSPYLAGFLLIVALIVLIKDNYNNRKKSAPEAGFGNSSLKERRTSIQAVSQQDTNTCNTKSEKVVVPTSWSIKVLQALEWRRFEELCEAVFNEFNLVARNTQFGADGGVDIELYAKNEPDTLVAIAQCKAWSNPVGVKYIREFYGVMAAAKISKGYFVTTSSFTEDAVKFSKASEVTLISGKHLLKLITSLSLEQSAKLLKLATTGDYTTPTCPSCGLKMIARKASKTGKKFWGCSSYPRCKGKLNMKSTL